MHAVCRPEALCRLEEALRVDRQVIRALEAQVKFGDSQRWGNTRNVGMCLISCFAPAENLVRSVANGAARLYLIWFATADSPILGRTPPMER